MWDPLIMFVIRKDTFPVKMVSIECIQRHFYSCLLISVIEFGTIKTISYNFFLLLKGKNIIGNFKNSDISIHCFSSGTFNKIHTTFKWSTISL